MRLRFKGRSVVGKIIAVGYDELLIGSGEPEIVVI